MTPRLTCTMLCVLLTTHTSQFATYKGIPDPDPFDGAVIMATANAPRWQAAEFPDIFDSEVPSLGVTIPLPTNAAPAASGAAFTLGHGELGQLGRNLLGG
ncbi:MULTISPECIES: hypothetical protein [Micromonospora]|nr:hypothetical protein [Micromonospora tulbaghiae]